MTILKNRRAFTLIEMLMVVGLVSFIFACATTSFWQGTRVYRKLINVSDDLEAAFFLDKITQDIKNSMDYSRVPFQSGSNSVSFATLRQDSLQEQAIFSANVLKVTYLFKPDTGEIIRSLTDPYSQKEIKREALIGGVEEFHFDLFPEGTDQFPTSARVTLVFGQGQTQKTSKLIDIPFNYAPAH